MIEALRAWWRDDVRRARWASRFWDDPDDEETLRVNRVRAGESIQGDAVDVAGDVAREVRGRTVDVEGDVLPGARIVARGGGASIRVEGDVSAATVLDASGAGAAVVIYGDVV